MVSAPSEFYTIKKTGARFSKDQVNYRARYHILKSNPQEE